MSRNKKRFVRWIERETRDNKKDFGMAQNEKYISKDYYIYMYISEPWGPFWVSNAFHKSELAERV